MLRLIRRFAMLCFALLFLSPIAAQQIQDLVLIRAIWTADVFVIINTSDSHVDASALRFESPLGEITPSNWQMANDPATHEQYSLFSVRPGSCLVAYFGTGLPNIPSTVQCDRTIGQFIVTTTDDLIWSVVQGGFTPYVGDFDYTQCSIQVSSCDFPVPRADEDAPETMTVEPEQIEIRAIWTPQVFVLINTSGQMADISSLRLVSERGEITPDDWELDFFEDLLDFYTLKEMRPGSCLVAHLGSNRPPLPDTVQCHRIMGRFAAAVNDDLVWSVTQGGFTPYLDDTALESCTVERSSCSILLPNPAIAASQAVIQAVWDDESLFLLNTSDTVVDMSSLQLVGDEGFITPDDWIIEEGVDLDAMQPGQCLLTYWRGIDSPELPDECEEIIGEYVIESPENAVWSSDQNEFVPYWGDTPADACTVEDGTCEIIVPS